MPHTRKYAYEKLATGLPAKELSTLLRVSGALASTLDLSEVLQIAIASAADMLGLDTGAIYTLEAGDLYLGATIPPLPDQFLGELRVAHLYDHPHIYQVVKTRAPVYLKDARLAELTPAEKVVVESRQLVSILYFPLILKDEVTGVFIVGTNRGIREFSKDEIDLCNILSYQVSLAIANASLYQKTQQAVTELSQAYDATLEGWSRVLDMRDHITDQHTHRVADLTVTLASRMGIPASEMGHILRGAILHDIGKMAIPDAILQKPGVLTDDERQVMQSHPEKAYSILIQIPYLAPALDIPYCHHERWDGTGYPRHLKGEAIPLAARIFAVVDVFDALTSDRPYRKAWTKEAAMAHIQSQSGKHFYPDAVDAFFKLMLEIG